MVVRSGSVRAVRYTAWSMSTGVSTDTNRVSRIDSSSLTATGSACSLTRGPLSPSEIPAERLEFARTAAGFWHNYLSPLHGAVLAGTVANGGEMMRPYVVDEVIDARGGSPYRAEPTPFRSVIPQSTARVLGRMMEHTVQRGTARRAFFDQEGRPFLPGIRVAGKTI